MLLRTLLDCKCIVGLRTNSVQAHFIRGRGVILFDLPVLCLFFSDLTGRECLIYLRCLVIWKKVRFYSLCGCWSSLLYSHQWLTPHQAPNGMHIGRIIMHFLQNITINDILSKFKLFFFEKEGIRALLLSEWWSLRKQAVVSHIERAS